MTSHPRAALITIAAAPAASLPALLSADVEKAADLARQEKAKATQHAYASDFGIFRAWCAGRGVRELPATPETVAAFLASEVERGIRSSTIGRRVAALRYAHKLAGLPLPTEDERVRATVRGIRRTTSTAAAKKAPVTADKLLAMVAPPGRTLAALRDRALLLLGFAGAFRRSELVALDVADFEETSEGLKITIRQSKTDQDGAGATIAVVRGSVACPAKALKAWLAATGILDGPIFRPINKAGKVRPRRMTAQSVALIVKAHATRVGLDPAQFSGHSLRAGFLTSAAKRGASIFKMMDVSRHRSVDTLRGYVRDAELFQDHAGTGLL
jgi:site-specific recombinase XerD